MKVKHEPIEDEDILWVQVEYQNEQTHGTFLTHSIHVPLNDSLCTHTKSEAETRPARVCASGLLASSVINFFPVFSLL